MKLQPQNIKELQEGLARSTSVDDLNLSALDQLIDHVPEDMTATAQAGMTLAAFQKQLAQGGQWLPVDPPHPENLSTGSLLANNTSGPRRLGFGTIRDWLIGLAFILPDGRLVRNGGKVVKNVAGFDLCRLMVGSRGTLGIIVEATFKLLPLPESETLIQKECNSLGEAEELLEQILASNLQPCILDLHRINGQPLTLVAGFSGATADVEAQTGAVQNMGLANKATLSYDEAFRCDTHRTESIAPSKLIDNIKAMGNAEFVARAANGVIYSRTIHEGQEQANIGKSHSPESSVLQSRIKDLFDPKGKLPRL